MEPGVDVIFVSLPHGGIDLRRINFKYVKKWQELMLSMKHWTYQYWYRFEKIDVNECNHTFQVESTDTDTLSF